MKRKKNLLYLLVIVNFLAVLLPASYVVRHAAEFARQVQNDRKTSAMYAPESETHTVISRGSVTEPRSPVHEIEKPPEDAIRVSRRFEALSGANPDFAGMLIIPALELEYPFVRGNDNSRYLSYDFFGRKSPYGTIFLDYRNSLDFSDRNSVLYGHNMKNGTMFHKLSGFNEIAALMENPVVYIDSPDGRSEWLVFAAYICKADCGYINKCESEESFIRLLEAIRGRDGFDNGIEADTGDTLLTLSTCNYSFKNARFAVHARKVRAGEDISRFKGC